MLTRVLSFEQPLVELEERIDQLRQEQTSLGKDHSAEIERLEAELQRLIEEKFADLTPWDQVLLARHPQRPYTLDYVHNICDDWLELHGDRCYGDDPALIGGLGAIEGRTVVLIGHQKGRDTKERQYRNFGSAGPEGYRKAIRMMEMADRLRKPLISLVDTPAAACLTGAEERGISEAIARAQLVMSGLSVPVVVVVIGEGGSGGAIGIAVGNRVYMLEHSIYSVIPPEGCASIIWRDSTRGPEAAAALRLTARDAVELGVADEVIPEPPGGAHRDYDTACQRVKAAILRALEELEPLTPAELVEQRYQRFRQIGRFRRESTPNDAPPVEEKSGAEGRGRTDTGC